MTSKQISILRSNSFQKTQLIQEVKLTGQYTYTNQCFLLSYQNKEDMDNTSVDKVDYHHRIEVVALVNFGKR